MSVTAIWPARYSYVRRKIFLHKKFTLISDKQIIGDRVSETRLIAFFDLLGFKAIVENHPLSHVVEILKLVFNAAFAASARHVARINPHKHVSLKSFEDFKEADSPESLTTIFMHFENVTGLKIFLMSDSIVIYSKQIEIESDEFIEECKTLITVSRILMMRLFEMCLPARGALAYNEFYADSDSGIYCGKGLVEAYTLAESQEWIGVVISESLDNAISEIVNKFKYEELVGSSRKNYVRPFWDVIRYDVPFKSDTRSSWVVNWASAWNHGGYVRDDFFENRLTGNLDIDKKYHNTLAFLKTWPTL